MRRLLILATLSIFLLGCASTGYQPGSPGVRDLPPDVDDIHYDFIKTH